MLLLLILPNQQVLGKSQRRDLPDGNWVFMCDILEKINLNLNKVCQENERLMLNLLRKRRDYFIKLLLQKKYYGTLKHKGQYLRALDSTVLHDALA